MRNPAATSLWPTLRWVGIVLGLVLVALLAVPGWLLIVDRPGLEARYFALGQPWQGKVLATSVGEPRLGKAGQVRSVLMKDFGFSILWAGWWDLAVGGEHEFSLLADDGGYLRLDGEVVVDTAGRLGEVIESGIRVLEPGFHRVEIGLVQRDGESRLDVQWTGPGVVGSKAWNLPAADLYAGRPLGLRRTLRRALPSWPLPYRQLLGAAVLIGAVLLARWLVLLTMARWGVRELRWSVSSPRWRAGLLAGLFLVAFLSSLPLTGYLLGGDDAAYLSAATFSTKQWFANRYGHVYLLKLFTGLTGGDPLVGVRFWWSFVFATTVASLAVAVRSIGPGLQLRTLSVALFVLVAQTTVIGLIGAGFADYSAMMFVTAAVAVYLYGYVAERERGDPRHEWSALGVGALTVAAFRSKEVGVVLVLLPLLFLFVDGRFDPRRFPRRLAYWAVGAASVLAVLMVLDGLIVGDPFFTGGRGERFEMLEKMNFPDGRRARPKQDWMTTVWESRHQGRTLSLRFLWLGVCAATIVAGATRQRVELRLLHLLPLAFLGALVVLYVRMPHPFSPRMLILIAPVACLMTALLLRYAGLDDLSWRELLSPAALAPGGLLAGLLCFIMVPYRLGSLPGADFLPVELLGRFGWSPEHFLAGVALPAVALAAVGTIALGAGRPEVRVTALVLGLLAIFGPGFAISRRSLEQHHALQVANLLTYPWKAFEEEIDEVPSARIGLSRDLQTRMGMAGAARSSIAHLALGRRDVWVRLARGYPAGVDVAIASRPSWRRWRRDAGELESALVGSATWDALGVIVLVRPGEVAAQVRVLRWLEAHAAELAEGSGSRSEGRERLLRQILEDDTVPVRRMEGTALHAVNLYGDGWTEGTRPAGIVILGSGEEEAVQAVELSVDAAAKYPIGILVDDGERVETLVFERAGTRKLELGPVVPGASRLIVIWSDRAWTPGGGDERQLGVRVRAAPGH